MKAHNIASITATNAETSMRGRTADCRFAITV
jgi:hypothetical protein